MEADTPIRALIDRAREGDRNAFQKLVERYEERLRRLVRSRLGSGLKGQIDVADVVQDAFLRALQALPHFEWQGEDSFLRWLSRIATNSLRETARREKRRVIVPLQDDVQPRLGWSGGLAIRA